MHHSSVSRDNSGVNTLKFILNEVWYQFAGLLKVFINCPFPILISSRSRGEHLVCDVSSTNWIFHFNVSSFAPIDSRIYWIFIILCSRFSRFFVLYRILFQILAWPFFHIKKYFKDIPCALMTNIDRLVRWLEERGLHQV